LPDSLKVELPKEGKTGTPSAGSAPVVSILFLIDSFYGTYGGAEGALTRIVRNLPKDRYRARIATFVASQEVLEPGQVDCPIDVLPLKRSLSAFLTLWKLWRLIRREKITLVHTFFPISDLIGGVVAKLTGCLLVSSRRDMGILRSPLQRRLYRWMARAYDQVHTVSDEVRAYMIEHDGLDPKSVVTVYNGIDVDAVDRTVHSDEARRDLGVEPGQRLITTVCNVRPVKGVDVVIRAAAKVVGEFPDAVFAIVGFPNDPVYYQEMQDLRDSLGIQRHVLFPGLRKQIFAVYKASDIFCLPSRSEGFSNALIEAMAAGLPCVATRVGGNPEVVKEGHTGYIVENEDHEAMAERIRSLLRDPERAREMGQNGAAVIRGTFTTKAMTSRVVSFYDHLLAAKRRA
jgi:glycosyltransferase involved in cell wall biosynthesis